MEKIIFFGLVIPIFAFVLYLGGNAIMKGMSAKNANKENESLENDEIADVMNYILNQWGNSSKNFVTTLQVDEINKSILEK